MNEKMLAMIGVVVISLGTTAGLVFAKDAANVVQIAISAATLAGLVVTIWKIGGNTDVTVTAANKLSQQNLQQTQAIAKIGEKAETISNAVNGKLDDRFTGIEKMITKLAYDVAALAGSQAKKAADTAEMPKSPLGS